VDSGCREKVILVVSSGWRRPNLAVCDEVREVTEGRLTVTPAAVFRRPPEANPASEVRERVCHASVEQGIQ